MRIINNSVDSLTLALNQNEYVSCNKGKWQVDNLIVRIIRWLFGWNDERMANIIKNIGSYVDQLEERRPTLVRGSPLEHFPQKIYLKVIEDLAAAVDRYAQSRIQNRGVRTELDRFRVKIAGFVYRMGAVNDGKDRAPQPDQNLVGPMTLAYRTYKRGDPMYHDKELLRSERAKIQELCRYPDLCRILINNQTVANHIFKIAIRDNVDVQAVVEFPYTVNKLYRSHLTCRIGAFARKLLEVDMTDQKKLNLWVHGRKFAVSDPDQEIEFRNRSRTTVGQILESYSNLNDQPSSGEYDFFIDGLRLWNGHKWGSKRNDNSGEYDVINYHIDGWWNREDFPLFDTASKEEIEFQYKIKIEGDNNCVQVLASTRTAPGITLQGHGYYIMYLPMPGGRYRVLPFGLYANQFPVTALEKVTFIGSTLPGTIVYPDPNYMYTRQKACLAQAITMKQAEDQMRRIAYTKINGGWFMWSFENCCYYAKNLFMNAVNNENMMYHVIKHRLFKVLFRDAQSDGFIKGIRIGYGFFEKMGFKRFYENTIYWLIRSRRILHVRETHLLSDGTTQVIESDKSAYTSKFGQKQKNNLPSVFHTHVERGEVPGAVLLYGHGRNES